MIRCEDMPGPPVRVLIRLQPVPSGIIPIVSVVHRPFPQAHSGNPHPNIVILVLRLRIRLHTYYILTVVWDLKGDADGAVALRLDLVRVPAPRRAEFYGVTLLLPIARRAARHSHDDLI